MTVASVLAQNSYKRMRGRHAGLSKRLQMAPSRNGHDFELSSPSAVEAERLSHTQAQSLMSIRHAATFDLELQAQQVSLLTPQPAVWMGSAPSVPLRLFK